MNQFCELHIEIFLSLHHLLETTFIQVGFVTSKKLGSTSPILIIDPEQDVTPLINLLLQPIKMIYTKLKQKIEQRRQFSFIDLAASAYSAN